MAMLANSSHLSFRDPRVPPHPVPPDLVERGELEEPLQSSRFRTTFLSAVRQPRARQEWIQTVIPFFRYWESV